ncbi:hypothetical protein [Bradyrhizobium sp. LHD-71]|uniref:hypothetical protein n=1 Tax=Bradyrhizobium sp. LHD-71 TaxID=3072141 RepID=UPI00280CF2B1|nr:hypothetical protein [Bradyrhizobium sp. LHD-71]MDQ8731467.1 hypothetical protein [Bradyrhizobium sp. LHD-71]
MSWLFELHTYLDKIYETNPTLITLGVIGLFLLLFLSSRTLTRSKVTTIAVPLLVMAVILGIAALYFGESR